jgi:YYY domain-containing protein
MALGLVGAVATAVMGNLETAVEVVARQGYGSPAFWRSVGEKHVHGPGAGWFPDDGAWWFGAARVIPNIEPDGITEFPWFSLILGDLHPHFVALPFDLLAIGLAVVVFGLLLAGREPDWLDTTVAALVLGLLIPLNTWDVGTFWIVYTAAVAAGLALRRRLQSEEAPPLGAEVRYGVGLLGGTFGLAIVLYLPYFLGYQSQPLGIGVVGERTMLGSLLILFGPFLVLAAATVLRGWLDGLADPEVGPPLRRWLWVVGLAGIFLAALTLRDHTLAVLLALLLGTTPLVVAAWQRPAAPLLTPAGLLLLICALGLLLGTELLFIRDSFGTRMNTVFKFHYHVWLLFGLLSPLLALYLVGGGAREASTLAAPEPSGKEASRPARAGPPALAGIAARGVGLAGVALAAGLGLAGLLYPVGATWTKVAGFRGPATLDGAAWLEQARPGDAQAIRWLMENVPGRPVIVEAVGDDYSEYARVSTFAGLPTLMGWAGHEFQWRGPIPELERRKQIVEAVYRSADAARLPALLQDAGARYVYVGRLEMERYGGGVLDRFETLLEPVFQTGDVTIYRVPDRPSGVGVGLAAVRP